LSLVSSVCFLLVPFRASSHRTLPSHQGADLLLARKRALLLAKEPYERALLLAKEPYERTLRSHQGADQCEIPCQEVAPHYFAKVAARRRRRSSSGVYHKVFKSTPCLFTSPRFLLGSICLSHSDSLLLSTCDVLKPSDLRLLKRLPHAVACLLLASLLASLRASPLPALVTINDSLSLWKAM
jgi:hypothetical protein